MLANLGSGQQHTVSTRRHLAGCCQNSHCMLQRQLGKALFGGFGRSCRSIASRAHFRAHQACARSGKRRSYGSASAQGPTSELTWGAIAWLSELLDAVGAAYYYQGASAAWIQGVRLPGAAPLSHIQAAVQWDFVHTLHQRIQEQGCRTYAIEAVPGGEQFSFERAALNITLSCQYNVVVAVDPNRVTCPLPDSGAQLLWVQSLHAVRRAADSDLAAAVAMRLAELQQELSHGNDEAWTQQDTYSAWLQRFGSPADAAARIMRDPTARLAPLHRYTGPLKGVRVANLFGSYGTKAVAMALLGADVTVFDLSSGNARFAQELAAAAGVPLRYVVIDVLKLQAQELNGDYSLVVMELGVLHYLFDLQPLMHTVAQLLAHGGRLVLREFHPISTKLITSKGKKHKVSGNYFAQELRQTNVAHSKHTQSTPAKQMHATQQQQGQEVRLRQWTLGEVVTAVADAGLMITELVEEPGAKLDDVGVPKLYTLVARKI